MPSLTNLVTSSAPHAKRNSNGCGASVHCMYAPHTDCRACGTGGLETYLDLGEQAPANALRGAPDGPEFTAPLSVSWCPECGLSQLDQVVDPLILYTNYPFRAGTSRLWQSHCAMLMTSLASPGRKFLIDIGSNDGTLLQEGVNRHWKVLGIDPSPADTKVPTLEGLWSAGMARRIARLHGQADVVTATNVFGHVDDAKDFLSGISMILKPRGLAVIECPHIFPLLEHVQFDTIYHEHLSYWSLIPLERLAESVGLKVINVQMYSDLHGGTARYVLTPGDSRTKVSTGVTGLRVLESAHFKDGLEPYWEFAFKVHDNIETFLELLTAEKGKRIWAYGASAKGNVLLQAARLADGTIERIVDDTEAKWGLFTPGTHIPITPATELSEPDILILLSWNNAKDLRNQARARGFRGRFFVPHPIPHFEDT